MYMCMSCGAFRPLTCRLLYDLNAVVELKRRMTMEALTQDDRVVDVPAKGTLQTIPRITRAARLQRMSADRPFWDRRSRSRLTKRGPFDQRILSSFICDSLYGLNQNNDAVLNERLNRTTDRVHPHIKENPIFYRYQIKRNSHRKRRLTQRCINLAMIRHVRSKRRITGRNTSKGGAFRTGWKAQANLPRTQWQYVPAIEQAGLFF